VVHGRGEEVLRHVNLAPPPGWTLSVCSPRAYGALACVREAGRRSGAAGGGLRHGALRATGSPRALIAAGRRRVWCGVTAP
jgi:hypothetical protein